MMPQAQRKDNGPDAMTDGATEEPAESRRAPREEPAAASWTARFCDWVRDLFPSQPETLMEALEEVIEEHEEDEDREMSAEEKQMLQNLLRFGDLEVSDVMIHRPEIIAVPHDIGLHDLKEKLVQCGHSRLPVYRGTLDKIIGLVHGKDLFPYIGVERGFSLKQILRPIFAVPPSMKAVDLLVKMRSAGSHMALVVDEYGGTDGIVTLEDLFEEIVGDIQDEHDERDDEHEFTWLDRENALVDARIDLEDLEEKLRLALVDEEFEDDFHTLGGLIFHLLGHVPHKGEKVSYRGLMFVIDAADARRIHRVRIIRKLSESEPEE